MKTNSKSLFSSQSSNNNLINKLYPIIHIAICILATTIIFLEIAAFIADLCPADYWWAELEKAVTYDISAVIPVVAIAWGAVAIPMSFLLGQIERRNYGIRLIDFLIAVWTKAFALFLVISFCSQLIFILIAASYKMPVLFTVTAWSQIFYVILAYYMVLISLSQNITQCVIKDQSAALFKKFCDEFEHYVGTELRDKNLAEQKTAIALICHNYSDIIDTQHWLLKEMVINMDYSRIDDLKNLTDILKEILTYYGYGMFGLKTIYELFETMLTVGKKEGVYTIAYELFDLEGKPTGREWNENVKKGILGALISDRAPESYELCKTLMKKVNKTNNKNELKKLYQWSILWSIHRRGALNSPQELLGNELFTLEFYHLMLGNCQSIPSNNEETEKQLICNFFQSCLDFAILYKVFEIDTIIYRSLLNIPEYLFGGNNDEF